MNARVMPDRHFCDREPVHERERGKKSVHALEESQCAPARDAGIS